MDNIYYIWLAYIAGSFTTYIIMRGMIKFLRKSNAHIRNESDYYFLLMKLAFKMIHHADQELFESMFESMSETKRIRKTFDDNKKRIERTGKY